ncbi:hypothetical protein [Streptomyces sp. NPDC048496]|uniref:hypothetical protein n=1 Tax=Streptomyces sp. NPDC048496 TaxID=3365558 RepID=UPI003715A1D4
MLVVATSFVEKTVVCGRRLALLNRHAISARRGLMVSGLPGTGKTSAISQLGLAHELLDRARPQVLERALADASSPRGRFNFPGDHEES